MNTLARVVQFHLKNSESKYVIQHHDEPRCQHVMNNDAHELVDMFVALTASTLTSANVHSCLTNNIIWLNVLHAFMNVAGRHSMASTCKPRSVSSGLRMDSCSHTISDADLGIYRGVRVLECMFKGPRMTSDMHVHKLTEIGWRDRASLGVEWRCRQWWCWGHERMWRCEVGRRGKHGQLRSRALGGEGPLPAGVAGSVGCKQTKRHA